MSRLEVNKEALDKATANLEGVLQESIDIKIISKDENEAMQPKDKGSGKFYCTFKVNKVHDPTKAPP